MTGTAFAHWTAGSVPGGNGAAAATTVNQGAKPTATVAGGNITVAWAASTMSNGGPVSGYTIKRYAAVTLTPQAVLTGCSGTVITISCTETGAPSGQWVYSVTPVLGVSWKGAESPKGDVVTLDTTPPANNLTALALTGNVFLSAATLFYRGVAAGSARLTNAVSDTGSGPASSSTAELAGVSTGWSHVPSTVSAPSGGPYVSNALSWTAGTTSPPTETVTGRDVAGNGAATTLSLVNDSTAPTAGTITYADGYQPSPSVSVAFTTGTDAGSGIASRQLQRSSGTALFGLCDLTSYGPFANVGAQNPTSPTVDSAVADNTCYKYRYVVSDRLGNQTTATSANVAQIDSSTGGPSLRSAFTYSVLAGTGVANTGLTNLSGDLGVSPSSSVVGFPPGVVAGDIHAGDAAAAQARTDLGLAYTNAASRLWTGTFAGDLNGATFRAGVYHTSAAMALTGTMTLDGENNPDAVFIFQVDAAMNTAAASQVVLANGAKASNVYWQVNGAAGTGATSTLVGTILSNASITLGAGTVLIGRALAFGTVTLAGNTVRFSTALPPVIAIDGGATAVTKSTTPTISGTSNAATGTTVTVRVAGQVLTTTVQGTGTWSVTAAALTAGPHDVQASVRDAAGNAGVATQALTVEINPAPVALMSAGSYSVLAGTAVDNTGVTYLSGDLGVSPSISVVGFPPGVVGGSIHAGDTQAAQARTDLGLAYTDAAGRTPNSSFAGDLNGRTFHAGVHHTSAAMALTGTMTLDGENNPDAVFIFQIDAAMNTAAASQVVLANGTKASNVYWQVNGAAGTGATSTLVGTILSNASITLGAGTTLAGRALCYGTVTLAGNTVTTT